MVSVALHVAVVWVVETLSLLLLAWIVPGFSIDSWVTAALAVAVLGLLNAIIRPILLLLTLPFTVLTFGLLSLALNAAMLWLASLVLVGLVLGGFWTVTLLVIGLATANTITSGVLSLNDERSFYFHVVRRLKRRGQTAPPSTESGLIVLEIDGLAEPVLRDAIRGGFMPNVARLLESGSHRLVSWDTGLPSQTSACQAGILFGNSFGIPAFRWYEKDSQRLMVSSRPSVASEIERRVSQGPGLLHPDGSSIGNLVSGGAGRAVMTVSVLEASAGKLRRQSRDFYFYFLNPYNFSRAFVFMVKEVGVELLQGLRQRIRCEWPRVGRGGSFPFLRAMSAVLLRDLTTYLVVEDVLAGRPAIYATYLGYDVVAHHAGPFGPDVRGPLREIDRAIGWIETVVRDASRPYQLVLLSDHGQSQGATFRQRYGESLEELVGRLVSGGAAVRPSRSTEDSETWGHLNALLNELIRTDQPGRRAVRSSLRQRVDGEVIEVGPLRDETEDMAEPGDIQVCASGNLGLIYFLNTPGRMTLEEIDAMFPTLVTSLAAHPGVGVVLVRSEQHGPLAIGADGIHHLSSGTVDGIDPLRPFGPRAAAHLAALDCYPNCADLVVNSRVDPETGEVAAFEELVGSHGGLGGPQTSPFLLVPVTWTIGSDGHGVVGPDAVYDVLRQGVPAR